MRNWKLFKNISTEKPCWQLYYVEDGGEKRYFNRSFSYPVAAGLRDALMNNDIRRYAVEYWNMSLNKPKESFQYRKDNMETYRLMLSMTRKYDKEADTIYERLIYEAMKNE